MWSCKGFVSKASTFICIYVVENKALFQKAFIFVCFYVVENECFVSKASVFICFYVVEISVYLFLCFETWVLFCFDFLIVFVFLKTWVCFVFCVSFRNRVGSNEPNRLSLAAAKTNKNRVSWNRSLSTRFYFFIFCFFFFRFLIGCLR